jgi:hypothetical protein
MTTDQTATPTLPMTTTQLIKVNRVVQAAQFDTDVPFKERPTAAVTQAARRANEALWAQWLRGQYLNAQANDALAQGVYEKAQAEAEAKGQNQRGGQVNTDGYLCVEEQYGNIASLVNLAFIG